MDQAFRDAMAAGYALTEPGLDHRQPDARRRARQRRAGPGRAVDAQPSRPDRRRDRHRQDQDPAAARRPAVEGRRARLRRRHQGRPDRPGGARRRDEPEGHRARARRSAWTFEPAGHPVEFLSLSGKLGAQVRATVHSFGPLLLGKVLDLNDTQTSILALDLQVLRRQRPAAARPEGPDGDPQVPVVGRGQADPRRLRRDVAARRSACCCARSSCSSRRAPTSSSASPSSTSTTCCARRPRAQGIISVLELSDVMDKPRLFSHVHALDAGPAVREPARGRRPAEAEAVLLLRRGAPAVRRRLRGAAGPGRADRPADPLEGRRRLLRDPGPDRRAVAGPRPARATASSTRCARSRPTTPTRCARPPGPSR